MPQEDKLKREIDLLSKVLAKLLGSLAGLKNTDQAAEIADHAQQELSKELELGDDGLNNISSESLINKIINKKIGEEQATQLADILLRFAECYSTKEEVEHYLTKSLAIYEYLSQSSPVYSLERHYKIENIKQQLLNF